MELAPGLVPVFWGALTLLGASALVFFVCLGMLLNTHRPLLLRLLWISGSLGVAALSALLILLAHR